MYSEGSLAVPTSRLIIVEVTFFTVAMSSFMLLVVSMTKQRALLDPLKRPIILGEGDGKR